MVCRCLLVHRRLAFLELYESVDGVRHALVGLFDSMYKFDMNSPLEGDAHVIGVVCVSQLVTSWCCGVGCS